jgi:hypothetical protein
MQTAHRTGLIAIAVGLLVAACGSHPEENSGGDAYRSEAQPMPLDEWVTGELDLDNGDTTDWKQVSVEAGKLTIELKADKKGASIRVAVYDKHGLSIGMGAAGGKGEGLTVPVNAKSDGKLFIKIEHRGGDKTAYSVRAQADAGGGGGGPDL